MPTFAGEPYGQLQLELEGIPMLTQAEQLALWLDSEDLDPLSAAGIEAALTLRDSQTRQGRAQRWLKLREIEDRYPSTWGWLVPGSPEGLWLYADAVSAYVNAEYLAAVVCSHAAAERTLAARLQLQGHSQGLERAGLGPLVRKAHALGLIDDQAEDHLLRLNDIRRPIAHHKPPLTPHSVMDRLRDQCVSSEFEEEVDSLLRGDAELAIECAVFAIRGMSL